MGYALHVRSSAHTCPRATIAYWGGWGGSSIIVDTDRSRSRFAYVMNRMDEGLLGDMRGINLAQEVFKR